MSKARIVWLRQHTPGEQRLKKALAKFFRAQAKRVAEAIGDYDRGNLTPKIAAGLLDANAEHKLLMRVVAPEVGALMQTGALIELKTAPKKVVTTSLWTKADDDSFEISPDDVNVKITPEVLARIQNELRDLESQPYWKKIQATSQHRIASLVEQGLENGDALRDIVSAIGDALKAQADGRALLIARTEVTGALNAGHYAAREELIQEGLITGTEWVALLDADTREEHAAADGQVVKDGEDFIIGGEACRFPGDWSLSASQRANCRCTTVAAGTFAD